MKTKLGPKLQKIFELITPEYSEVWDTCCDHGKLGMAVLESNKSNVVHFVDQVPSIINELENKLLNIASLTRERYKLHGCPAENLQVSSSGKTLICICGVGGEVVIKIMQSLLKNNDLAHCDFLLSPQYHLFEVRRFLKEKGFNLKKEELSFEGKFGRELLLVSLSEGEEIDPIGSKLFDSSDERHQNYLKNIVSHLEKKGDAALALEHYKKILD